MSLAHWYRHKEQQCAKLANVAADAHARAVLKAEQSEWRLLARQIVIDDRADDDGKAEARTVA